MLGVSPPIDYSSRPPKSFPNEYPVLPLTYPNNALYYATIGISRKPIFVSRRRVPKKEKCTTLMCAPRRNLNPFEPLRRKEI